MNYLLEETLLFFVNNFPSWHDIMIGGPLSLIWAFFSLRFSGFLKQKGVKTSYTRKVFHFLIFITVTILQLVFGTPIVCLFGGMCTFVILFAVWQGKNNVLYEAIAREKDEPHRTLFIVIPYLTTLLGGLISNILFGKLAIAGYLVSGLGDAIGEPIGALFGKHQYRVPSLLSVPATRSWEGSLAVFFMSFIAISLASVSLNQFNLYSLDFFKNIAIAFACAVAEALSPHGLDNITMQFTPSIIIWLWV
jgi:phytol kinase